MKSPEAISKKLSMPIAIAYMIVWCVMGFFLTKFLMFGEMIAPIDWMMFFLSLSGVACSYLWIKFSNRWVASLVTISILYFLLYAIRLYSLMQIDTKASFWQKISEIYSSVWTVSEHAFSEGWLLFGIEVIFYDWAMPFIQIVLLILLLVFNPSFSRERISKIT